MKRRKAQKIQCYMNADSKNNLLNIMFLIEQSLYLFMVNLKLVKNVDSEHNKVLKMIKMVSGWLQKDFKKLVLQINTTIISLDHQKVRNLQKRVQQVHLVSIVHCVLHVNMEFNNFKNNSRLVTLSFVISTWLMMQKIVLWILTNLWNISIDYQISTILNSEHVKPKRKVDPKISNKQFNLDLT